MGDAPTAAAQDAPAATTTEGAAPLSDSERDELERLRAEHGDTAHHQYETGPEPDPASAGVPGTPGVRDHYDHLRAPTPPDDQAA